MKKEQILNVMDHVDPALIEGMDGRTAKKRLPPIARTGLVAACLCAALVGTVLATGEMDYSMWATYEHSFVGFVSALRARGYEVEFPEQFGDYSFESVQKLYVVPEGTQFLEAISGSAVYQPVDITYRDYDYKEGSTLESSSQRDLGIAIGKTDGEYWSTYFSFDPVTMEYCPDAQWAAKHELMETEYKGRRIYLASKREVGENEAPIQYAKWVDPELGLCFSVSLGLSGWQGDISAVPQDCFPGDIMPYVERIIDHFG